ncbi:hypothetical protein BU24DRAFT_419277 [Aaosphaeria arxii CBS 175.79]|uniref:TOM core complex subunit Tom6 n=1 Tax=Aaosphaeria arxii CBS 175.79 TaxID=1450172 RepID=A0A6A5Y3P6_9PLEO|nr:uncharacterized protein BU24DRAFT_419277 [Aaosphaeria arxii CBS 175.79]KAF2019657.1 hypothetical protein BU24DRAFT_419277 [Aaosphaeria arxii CBS 175.79]
MPPKTLKSHGGRTLQEPSFGRSVVQTFTSSENRPIVTAIGLFAIGVTFLHSSWSEILLPM